VVDEDVLSERDGPCDRLIVLPVSSRIFLNIFSETGLYKVDMIKIVYFYKYKRTSMKQEKHISTLFLLRTHSLY
jgi:hypothetical protein